VGVTAALVVAGIVFHHRGPYHGVVFDSGWQFEMDLQSPLSVDAASIAAAIANPQ
jgi:hypothetical protein